MSFAPAPMKPPVYAADGNGFVYTPKPPKYAADGGGFTAKVPTPPDSLTISDESSSGSKTKTVVGAAVLLVGGAILGYGHKDVISKGLKNLKESCAKLMSGDKMQGLVQKGKDMLATVKDKIFVK